MNNENTEKINEAAEAKEKSEEKTEEKAEEQVQKKLVSVQFSSAGKLHTYESGNLDLKIHDIVLVEGDKGPIIGTVMIPPFDKNADKVATNLRKVLHIATDEDLKRREKNRETAMKSFNVCQQKISFHNLPMKLVDVDMLSGDNKSIFYFTAEERVDFRALVKDLASTLHMRIEMRQIGARDAAKNIGGIGSCGYTCCCETHLREFKSIAIQMAKNQGLSPNPTKLTGMCGKLKCCLLYENDMYLKLRKGLPRPGTDVKTPDGIGRVNSLDIPRQFVDVYLHERGDVVRYKREDLQPLPKNEKREEREAPQQGREKSREKRGNRRPNNRSNNKKDK